MSLICSFNLFIIRQAEFASIKKAGLEPTFFVT